jgi:hypothetical protein
MSWVKSNVGSRVSKHNTPRPSPYRLIKLNLSNARLYDGTLTVSWSEDAIRIYT